MKLKKASNKSHQEGRSTGRSPDSELDKYIMSSSLQKKDCSDGVWNIRNGWSCQTVASLCFSPSFLSVFMLYKLKPWPESTHHVTASSSMTSDDYDYSTVHPQKCCRVGPICLFGVELFATLPHI